MKASPEMKKYFQSIDTSVKNCYQVAAVARMKGLDPEKEVPIPLAKNMAERVVGLISVVAPQISGSAVTTRIEELEKEFGLLDWRVGFQIALEVAQQKFFECETKELALEIGIRVGFAYLTLGIVSAPLEGFIGLKIKKRKDGKEYFALKYAGPIRGAGGTAASTSVILGDYVRVKMGYAAYDPEEKEVSRYTTEIHDYHDRVTNLQYHPSDKELNFLISNLPVEVDGDPTEKFEVSNYKDLPRIETNLIRGGVALVLAEGLSQKAPKLWKRLGKWGEEFGLGHWSFLGDLIKIKEEVHSAHETGKNDSQKSTKKTVKPNNTFIMDLVAGRPILTHPLATGGFRLRYGRSRVSGFSASALNPATMIVLNKYIAVGTQLKVERPGKAATITVCESLEGPIVRTKDGSVLKLNTEKEAKDCFNNIEEVIFLGDILFNYGDFSENGHSLVPAGYCPEWWAVEVERAISQIASGKESKVAGEESGEETGEKTSKETGNKTSKEAPKEITQTIPGVSTERLQEILANPCVTYPSFSEAVSISSYVHVPLHPEFTHYWALVEGQDISLLLEWLKEGKIKFSEGKVEKIILPYIRSQERHCKVKRVLELLGIPHIVVANENLVLEKTVAQVIALCFNITSPEKLAGITLSNGVTKEENLQETGLEVVNSLSKIKFRDKAGTFIGARMGRPEKAKMRHLTGSPQVMFPVGEEGDRLRSFQSALKAGKVRSAFPLNHCRPCKKDMVYPLCEECGQECEQRFHCRFCGDLDKEQCRHGQGNSFKQLDLDIAYFFKKAKERIGEKLHPDLIKGVRGTSNKHHVVEHLSKGILRAKHSIYVNKDGTTRYDCTELPITHFKPKEIHTSVERLKELGYLQDAFGNEFVSDDQLLEIKPQDIILPGFDSLEESGPRVLSRVSQFVDELLQSFYKQKPFYNVKQPQDLAGHLVIGLAPHISAGMVGRIIGYSETQGLLTHPMFHAGLRRDCDGDEACVMLLMDALLNFSRKYLPERRGAKTMDSPLVLTSFLNPTEVDDQVHGMDVMWKYPVEFYEAAMEMKNPWDVKFDGKKITQLNDRLGTPLQYEDFGFTHPVQNFNKGVVCSAYKTEPSMMDKLFGQMDIAQKVRAVDMDDVAKLVIQKHFLKDIKGNLRKFSMQKFRCVKCNAKYRRPPLSSKCGTCQGKLIFTISHGSVVKYLKPSLVLAEQYNFSPYLKQVLDVLKNDVENVFGKEKDKQVGLASFIPK